MPYNNNGEFYNDVSSNQGIGAGNAQLQELIDKTTSMAGSVSRGRGAEIMGRLTNTVAGLQGQTLADAGANTRLGISNKNAMDIQKNALGMEQKRVDISQQLANKTEDQSKLYPRSLLNTDPKKTVDPWSTNIGQRIKSLFPDGIIE